MAAKSLSRAAAWTAAAILTVTAASYFYWGVGGTWGTSETSGGAASSTSELIGSVIIGLVGLGFAAVLLVRVGYWRGHVPPAAVRMTRLLVFVALGGAVAQFAAHGFVEGTLNLGVALLAFVVARSDLPAPPEAGRG